MSRAVWTAILATVAVAAVLATSWLGLPGDLVATGTALAMIGIPWLLRPKDLGPRFGLSWQRDLKPLLLWCALVFPPFVLGYHLWYVSVLGASRGPTLTWSRPPLWLPELILTHVVAVALPEEIFFRGFIQRLLRPWLREVRLPWIGRFPLAILAASALFASLHLVSVPAPGRLAVFFPGLLFGLIYERSDSLTGPILFHAASNILLALCDLLWFG